MTPGYPTPGYPTQGYGAYPTAAYSTAYSTNPYGTLGATAAYNPYSTTTSAVSSFPTMTPTSNDMSPVGQQLTQVQQQLNTVQQQLSQLFTQREQVNMHLRSKGYSDLQIEELVNQRKVSMQAQVDQLKEKQRQLSTLYCVPMSCLAMMAGPQAAPAPERSVEDIMRELQM